MTTLPFVLSSVIAALMAIQALLGRLFEGQYRDVAWIRATWFGNDLVTLLLAVPLLVTALLLSHRGSVRGVLLWCGVLGYSAYNYAYYMLGAALNAFFPLYVGLLVLSAATLILLISQLDVSRLTAALRGTTIARIVGGYFMFVAVGLAIAWFGMWAAYVFGGRPTPVEPDAFRLVAALDTSIMVPAMGVGGALLWIRNPWGCLLCGMAGIQGSLYLIVLSVNAIVAVSRGLVDAPGELPVWGSLAATTVVATAVLFRHLDTRADAQTSPDISD